MREVNILRNTKKIARSSAKVQLQSQLQTYWFTPALGIQNFILHPTSFNWAVKQFFALTPLQVLFKDVNAEINFSCSRSNSISLLSNFFSTNIIFLAFELSLSIILINELHASQKCSLNYGIGLNKSAVYLVPHQVQGDLKVLKHFFISALRKEQKPMVYLFKHQMAWTCDFHQEYPAFQTESNMIYSILGIIIKGKNNASTTSIATEPLPT